MLSNMHISRSKVRPPLLAHLATQTMREIPITRNIEDLVTHTIGARPEKVWEFTHPFIHSKDDLVAEVWTEDGWRCYCVHHVRYSGQPYNSAEDLLADLLTADTVHDRTRVDYHDHIDPLSLCSEDYDCLVHMQIDGAIVFNEEGISQHYHYDPHLTPVLHGPDGQLLNLMEVLT